MRDKILVPGSSTHGIDVSLFSAAQHARRCEHNGRVRPEFLIVLMHGAHRRLGMALVLGSASVYDAPTSLLLKMSQSFSLYRGHDDQASAGCTEVVSKRD